MYILSSNKEIFNLELSNFLTQYEDIYMNRIHCSLKDLDKMLKDKKPEEVYTTIRQDDSGLYMYTMTNGTQYITPLATPKKEESSKK